MKFETTVQQHETKYLEVENQSAERGQKTSLEQVAAFGVSKAVDDLLQTTQTNSYLPHQLKNTKKKKRKRISNNP
jgi:DNA polymerase IIIc chi subunit